MQRHAIPSFVVEEATTPETAAVTRNQSCVSVSLLQRRRAKRNSSSLPPLRVCATQLITTPHRDNDSEGRSAKRGKTISSTSSSTSVSLQEEDTRKEVWTNDLLDELFERGSQQGADKAALWYDGTGHLPLSPMVMTPRRAQDSPADMCAVPTTPLPTFQSKAAQL
eukprot:m.248218 g.248218  ORF g.248218 m.248218 type:complete len:166 (-) comp15411_c0_seq1:1647-2144(-)